MEMVKEGIVHIKNIQSNKINNYKLKLMKKMFAQMYLSSGAVCVSQL